MSEMWFGMGLAFTASLTSLGQSHLSAQEAPLTWKGLFHPWCHLLHERTEALTPPCLPEPLSSLTGLTAQTI